MANSSDPSETQGVFKSLCQRIDRLETTLDIKLESIDHKVENYEQTVQGIKEELTEVIQALHRLSDLLSVAVNQPSQDQISDHSELPRSEVDIMIDKIRRREF